jgi:hypothetical protein
MLSALLAILLGSTAHAASSGIVYSNPNVRVSSAPAATASGGVSCTTCVVVTADGAKIATETTAAAILAKMTSTPATTGKQDTQITSLQALEALLAIGRYFGVSLTSTTISTGTITVYQGPTPWVLNTTSVTLTAAQLLTLTPPAAITNYAAETGGNLASIKSNTDKIPSLGQALAANSAPVVLPAAQITTLTPPAAITNFANETGGNLASIKANTDKIPTSPATAANQLTDAQLRLALVGVNAVSTYTVVASTKLVTYFYVSTVSVTNTAQVIPSTGISLFNFLNGGSSTHVLRLRKLSVTPYFGTTVGVGANANAGIVSVGLVPISAITLAGGTTQIVSRKADTADGNIDAQVTISTGGATTFTSNTPFFSSLVALTTATYFNDRPDVLFEESANALKPFTLRPGEGFAVLRSSTPLYNAVGVIRITAQVTQE